MKAIHFAIRSGVAVAAAISVLLALIIEALGRHSLFEAFGFLWEEPRLFFYNAFLIFATLSLSLLVRRRSFALVAISSLWLVLGATNGLVLGFRMTPLTASDFALLENGLSVLPNYMSTFKIMLIVLGALLIIALYICAFLFAPKVKGELWFRVNLLLVLVFAISFYGITSIGIEKRWLGTYFGNLGYAYEDYGVPYCFMNTWLNRGIPLPPNYTESKVVSVFSSGIPMGMEKVNSRIPVDSTVGIAPKVLPNIIFVQLESFIDPLEINEIELSADPIPNFRRLQEGSSGYLTVPSLGAGTANTEFEVLTGMRIKNFGPGEYPYKTIMKEATCESINYILKDLGYTSHAIHNHRGGFYNRNVVFSHLGFDTFTSIEYMNNLRLTPTNWAKDRVLAGEITAALDATEGPDFVFAISVQGHGKYPEDKVIPDEELTIHAIAEDLEEEQKNALEYYVQQVYEMDQFVGDVVAAVDSRKERTVVVFYGDHLPVLSLDDSDMVNHSLYQTQYVMHGNYDLKEIDQDLSSFQLSSRVLELLGIERGVMPWFHRTSKNQPGYLSKLELLQYDMLYGQNYIFGGAPAYRPTDLAMGVREIRVDKIFNFEDNTYVVGENFTPYSKLAINGDFVDTIFVHSQLLKVEKKIENLDPMDYSISQVGKYNTVLSTLEDVE